MHIVLTLQYLITENGRFVVKNNVSKSQNSMNFGILKFCFGWLPYRRIFHDVISPRQRKIGV